MKRILYAITLIFSFWAFASCNLQQSKNTPIRELKSLSKQIDKNLNLYDEEGWNDIIQKYENIEALIAEYEDQYSEDELKEIARLKGKCIGVFTKKVVDSASKKIEDATSQFEGILDGFIEGLNNIDK